VKSARRSSSPQKPQVKNYVTPEKTRHHAEILANRVKKRYAHLRKRFARRHIDCFRLYDWDIPEVRAVVDWYAGHIVIAEYIRLQTGPDWLPSMAKAVGRALNVPSDKVHIKQRRTQTDDGPRYTQKKKKRGTRFIVSEGDFRFWVNLDDYLDTGLFSDHRETRLIIKETAKGKRFLNLFCYTGAFTCAAAAGGAKRTVSVDRSATYLKWAKDNLKLNGFKAQKNDFIKADVSGFLNKAKKEGERFDLVFVDPPSFFRMKRGGVSFDINDGHPDLIKAVMPVMKQGATLYFSTNHQRFMPRLDELKVNGLREITLKTIPEDYRNRQVHRCWKMEIV
jgi:23S rRNA (cytosine1962-C5)-methyltransferase